ncbi:MAG: PAS domain S-box protein, partial [Dehalococcoidia bacterium]|nr:PAS domain S-box protein [Dehalococcoidia bacterium]
VGIPVTAAFAEANDVLAATLAGMAAVLALAFVGAWLLGRAFVLRTVGRLLGVTHRLATGDLSARSGAGSGGGELGELGRAFDGMAESLQRRDAEAGLAAKEIRRSEERFRGLIENSSDAISLLSAELEILYNSPAARTILGYGKKVLGRNPFYFLHPEEKAEAAKIQQRVIQEPDTAVNFLVRMRHEDGTWRWVASTAKNMLANPAVGAIVVNWRDVTEQKRSEEALAESQRQYRSIFDNATEGILRTTLEGRITVANRAAARLLGYSSPEELMESVADAGELYAYEGATERILRRLGVEEEVKDVEMQARRKDGSLVWVLAGASPVRDTEGRLLAIQGMLLDISERKRAEETLVRLSAAVEQSADHVMITDANGVILYVNEAFVSLTGYSRDEAMGHTPRILKSGKHDLAFYENLWGTILSGNVFRGILTDRKKDGSLYYEEKTISPIHDAQGKITHFVSTARDVTGRLQREREMESLVKVADALRKAPNREHLMSALLDEVAALLGVEDTVLVMVNTGRTEKVVEIARGAWSKTVGERSPLDQGITGHIIQTGQPYVSVDPQKDPLFERKHLLEGINEAPFDPLMVQGEVLGVLGVGRSAPIIGEDVRLLTAVADMAAAGIRREALHEQTQKSLHRITSLRTVDMAISSSMDLRITIGVVLDQVVSQLGVDASCILQLNSRTGELEYAGGRGFRTEAVAGLRLRVGEGLAGRAVLERNIVHVPVLAGAEGVFLRRGVLKGEGFVSYLGVPLVAKGQVNGVLEVFHRSPLRPDHEWLEFLEALAGQMAIGVDNATLFDDLQRTNMELAIAYDATLEGWVKALDMRHKETEGHTRRVVALATRLGRAFGLSETEQVQLRRGALLHD